MLHLGVDASHDQDHCCGTSLAFRLLALALGAGPSGAPLDFRHTARSGAATLDDLGRLLLNAAAVVPGGLVAFFPSFAYADQAHARWGGCGC
jgi:chromosome transmission fidelity protein 1